MLLYIYITNKIYFVLVFFSPFSIAITSLGDERELILVLFIHLFVCACLVLSVSSSSWCLGKAAVCDCGTPWTFLFPLLRIFGEHSSVSPMLLSCFLSCRKNVIGA